MKYIVRQNVLDIDEIRSLWTNWTIYLDFSDD